MGNNGDKEPKTINETFDEFAQELQKELVDDELREYNARIVNLFHDPPNHGKLSGDHVIEHSYLGPCGDRMTFFLLIEGGIIKKARFTTTGCGASVATGAQTTLLIEAKSVEEALRLEPAMINDALGGLPPDHKHCAELAARTLHQALQKHQAMERRP
jgi:nitrogen fixation NifU-like protein